jgi:hypothetical protein
MSRKSWWSYYTDDWWNDDDYSSYYDSTDDDNKDKKKHKKEKDKDSSTTHYHPSYSHYGGIGGSYYYGGGSSYSYGGSYYSGGSYYKSGLGWGEDKYKSSYSFWDSESSSKKMDKTELLVKLYKSIRDIIIILDFPFPIDLRFCKKAYYKAAPNARKLYVPTSVVDVPDSEYSRDEKTNILCGLGIHEASHLKFTEYRMVKTILGMTALNTGVSTIDEDETRNFINFTRGIFNVLEDTRIEDKMLTERPGYVCFIDAEKKYRFSKFKDTFKSLYTFDDPVWKFLFNVVAFIRCPEEVVDVKDYADELGRIKTILEKMPDNTKDAFLTSSRLFLEVFQDLSNITSDTNKVKIYMGEFANLLNKSKLYEDIYYGADMDSGISINSGSISDAIISSEFGDNVLSKLFTGITEKSGSGKNVFLESMNEGTCEEYESIKASISQYIPNIKKAISGIDKNYTFNIYGCRSGKLDENKLAEAYQGVSQVYVRQGKVTTNKTTICVLVDESGSMRYTRDRDRLPRRYETARQAAILLNESLGKLPGVNLYIYGHSADENLSNETDIRIYREPGNTKVGKYSLSKLDARSQNRDGNAIKAVAERVKKLSGAEKVLMFVISDGNPEAINYYGYGAIQDTKKKVLEAEALGFNIVQVCIDKVNGCHEMFKHVITLDSDIANFPKKFGQIVKKAVIADKKTIIT